MRHFSRILFLLGITLSSVALSHAQTVTITDNFAPNPNGKHSAYSHWDQFSTTLSAQASDPTPQAEVKFGGAVYHWTGGNSTVHLTSTTGSSTGLENTLGTELPEGQNSINVQCYATFSRTDSVTGKDLGDISSPSASITVTFWSRVPKVVIQTAPRDHTAYTGQPYQFDDPNHPGQTITLPGYGHVDDYSLDIQDNQNDNKPDVGHRLPYGNGLPRETFNIRLGSNPNGSRGPSTWNFYPDGTGSPTDSFVDEISYVVGTYPGTNPGSQDLNEMEASFSQPWHCMELKPPYTPPRNLYLPAGIFDPDTKNPGDGDFLSNVQDTMLNTHNVDNHFGYAVRSYPGSPWPN
jgi:hypothetical protein